MGDSAAGLSSAVVIMLLLVTLSLLLLARSLKAGAAHV
jgi:hypothetical protein